MSKLQKLDQHVLVPALLVLANLLLALAVYMLHAWFSASADHNPLLLQAYGFGDEAAAAAFAQNRLQWGLLFASLLLAQMISLRVKRFSVSFILIVLSLAALLVLWW